MQKIYQKELLYPEILWERPVHYYKYHGGKIFVVAGSSGSANKASLVCEAIFRSGTGIITLGFPDILKNIYKDFLPEEMTLLLPTTPGGTIAQKSLQLIKDQIKISDALLIGPGVSQNAETIHLVWETITNSDVPTVICGDAIYALVTGIEVMRKKENEDYVVDYFSKIKGKLIIVISIEELSKIFSAANFSDYPNVKLEYVKKHKEKMVGFISQRLSAVVILNHDQILIAQKDELILTPAPVDHEIANELLSAVVASFVGQNPDKIVESTATAIYLVNLSLQLSKEKLNGKQIVSSDILKELPRAIKKAETA